jgi:hypothetical protein
MQVPTRRDAGRALKAGMTIPPVGGPGIAVDTDRLKVTK